MSAIIDIGFFMCIGVGIANAVCQRMPIGSMTFDLLTIANVDQITSSFPGQAGYTQLRQGLARLLDTLIKQMLSNERADSHRQICLAIATGPHPGRHGKQIDFGIGSGLGLMLRWSTEG